MELLIKIFDIGRNEFIFKKLLRKYGYTNGVLIALILLLWISAFFIGDLFGVYSWTILKLILPVVGAIGLMINFVMLIILIVKKQRSVKLFMNIVINIIFIFPILMTMNIILCAYPNTIERTQPSITVGWPLTEETVVGWGGNLVKGNLPHAVWASERWAYDLVMEPYNINSDSNENYGIWNKEINAPVSGIVVAVSNDEADITPGTEDFTSIEGNYVYIKIKETGTYLLLNHLKKDSVTVEVGDTVEPGDVIGRVGNSGSSSEPHLHIHHQRQDPTKVIHPVLAEGLPLFFEDIDGDLMPKKGALIKPQFH
ncbi:MULTISPECIES: M23 family metallopeptidase [Lysinibacillus]|uniref:M23 family metallopeptidase n=1 Tax=Lysinibacillus xylanilyticus TaxID=582475 RepID=A0ABV3W1N5_9BACI